jgi:hypothetical protein
MEPKHCVAGLMGILISAHLACASVRPPGRERYQQIVSANIFKLAQSSPTVEPAKPLTLPGMRLSGIVTYLAAKRVLLEVWPEGHGAPATARRSYLLAEGEKRDDIEIVRVDETTACAEVSYAGTPIRLRLK